MDATKNLNISSAVEAHVTDEGVRVTLLDASGAQVHLTIRNEIAEKLTHLMADALLARKKPGYNPVAGTLLVEGEVRPYSVEKKLTKLGFQEKYILQLASEGATEITWRLAPETAEKWALQFLEDASKRKTSH